jgi:hypothetical protein
MTTEPPKHCACQLEHQKMDKAISGGYPHAA